MHATPPDGNHGFPPPATGGSTSFGGGSPVDVGAILAAPTGGGTVTPVLTPAPAAAPRTRRARTPRPPRRTNARSRGGGQASPLRMLAWGVAALVVLGVGGVGSGLLQMDRPDDGGPIDRPGGSTADASWSYYHDRDYDSDSAGAKWTTDRSRTNDPAEAALGNTDRWEYDGPYNYGSYGSDAMRQRAAGRDTSDPLYSSPAPARDVFSQYGGNLDPSGGQPVGMAPSSMTNPYYDPYAGYSNPYANRIRLGWGEGVGRGANLDIVP